MNLIKRANIVNTLLLLLGLWIIMLLYRLSASLVLPLHFWIMIIDLSIIIVCFKLFFSLQKNKWDEEITNKLTDRFDPVQAAFILDGYVDYKDIIALFMLWGSMGYLEIQVNAGEIMLIRIKKIPPSVSDYQRELFSRIFKDSSTVRLDDLNQKFSSNMALCKAKVDKYFSKLENHIYTMESLTIQKIFSGLLSLPLCSIMAYINQMKDTGFQEIIAIILVSSLIALSMTYPVKLLIQIIYHWHSMTRREKMIKTTTVSFCAICILAFFTGFSYAQVPLLSAVSIFVTILLSLLMLFTRRRTPQGQEWNNRLLALKKFMLEASQETINRLHNQDPFYYFETLPYAYVMGISKEWSLKFAAIELPDSTWFKDYDNEPANFEEFHDSLCNHFNDIMVALTSIPQKAKRFGAQAI